MMTTVVEETRKRRESVRVKIHWSPCYTQNWEKGTKKVFAGFPGRTFYTVVLSLLFWGSTCKRKRIRILYTVIVTEHWDSGLPWRFFWIIKLLYCFSGESNFCWYQLFWYTGSGYSFLKVLQLFLCYFFNTCFYGDGWSSFSCEKVCIVLFGNEGKENPFG